MIGLPVPTASDPLGDIMSPVGEEAYSCANSDNSCFSLNIDEAAIVESILLRHAIGSQAGSRGYRSAIGAYFGVVVDTLPTFSAASRSITIIVSLPC